jgi:Lrp/AsnC family transcriptional regulator, leucine-responsive regulatory protein
MPVLDMKDRRILYELDLNSRIKYTLLAKKVGLKQITTRFRVERLCKNKIIQKFFTVINPARLNNVFYKLFIRLHNIDEDGKNKIMSILQEDKRIVWLADVEGSYDIGLVFKASSVIELENILEDIYRQFHAQISKHEISTNIWGEYLTRDYLIGKERVPSKNMPSYTSYTEQIAIDTTDMKIMQSFALNARTTSVQIAKELKISVDTVLQRIKKLEQNRIITRYNLVLNHEKINQTHHKVLIYTNDYDPEKNHQLLNYCRSLNRVVYIIKSFGQWNYELDIETENIDQYRAIMMKITKKFSTIIKDYDSLIVRKIYKYNLFQ